ncbi:hypothetical protein ACIQB5_41950 [Streptomyces sp. NPDC088560]|uniref:hypothetical protein n=1 Tax=Streptomyces sp. NPDC088560 TaxID=3365868 RepID=UPI0038035229
MDQVHAHATWAQLSRLFLVAPGMLASVALALVVSPLAWRTSSLWAIGVYLTFVYVSAALTCVDIWAVRNADSAGTVAAMRVLESFTTRADKAPAKSTRAAWQSQLIEQLWHGSRTACPQGVRRRRSGQSLGHEAEHRTCRTRLAPPCHTRPRRRRRSRAANS